MLSRLFTLATDKIYSLPIVVLMPHSRCNCRCVMCDIWKANHDKREISVELLQQHIDSFKKLKVREVVLSGGEALMHSNLWTLCTLLRENRIAITLLSTGLLLEKYATEIVQHMKEVIVSLDGSQAVHDEIRNVPQGFDKIVAGIRSIRSLKSDFRVTGRCVVQRHNFRDLIHTVKESRAIGLDQISFLAADVSTTAFNHQEAWTDARAREVALNAEESSAFEQIVQQSFVDLEDDYHKGFIAERPQKMTRIVQYYKAINGLAEFPETVCNAPWVSAVIESDGRVMPCFFHKPYGNIYDGNLADILNSEHAIGFRRNLDVHTDPVCKKCVCSLKLRVWD